MRFRNTILALIVLGGLSGYIYYDEYLGEASREAERRSKEDVFPFEQDAIQQIRITPSGGKEVTLERESGEWRLTAPIETAADADKVRTLLGGLEGLHIDRRLEDVSDADRKEYKLGDAAPRVEIRVKPAEGEPEESGLVIGDKTPVGSSRYASRPGSSEVMIVSGNPDPLLNADPAALRLKKLVGIESWKMSRVKLQHRDTTLELSRSDGEWQIDSPVRFPADGTKVQALLGELQSAEATGFETESPAEADLARLGLSDPALTLTVTPQGDGAPVTVTFGAPEGDATAYAKRSGMKAIAKVTPDLLGKLEQAADGADGLRDDRAAPIDRFMISRIDLKSPDRSVALSKDDESKWHWGGADGPVVPSADVNAVIDAVEAVKATSFDDHPAATDLTPILTAEITQGEGDEARKIALKVLPDSGKGNGLRRVLSTASSSLYLVSGDLVSTLTEKVAALHEPKQEAPAGETKTP